MNRPSWCFLGEIPSVRKEGDSNPRYGNPYGSLANCWFQPLTHQVQPFFQSCKYFANFFRKKLFKGYDLRQLGIEVERVLQGVALMYVAHSQIVKLSAGHVGVGNTLFEEWSAAMAHQLDE